MGRMVDRVREVVLGEGGGVRLVVEKWEKGGY
jgi:hypothetical protein